MGYYAGPAPEPEKKPIYGQDCLGNMVVLATYVSSAGVTVDEFNEAFGFLPRSTIHKKLNRLVADGYLDTDEYWDLIEELESDRNA